MANITSYKITRPGGDIIINVLKYSELQASLSSTYTLNQALNAVTDFSAALTLFAGNDTAKGYLQTMGFTSVYNLFDFAGEIWNLGNGYEVRIQAPTASTASLNVYHNNTAAGSFSVSSTVNQNMSVYSLWSDALIGNETYLTNLGVINNEKFRIMNGYNPQRIGTLQGNMWENIAPYIEPTDPYADGGYSGDGGGDGSFNLQNDSIDFPNLPTLSAVDTGLVSIYTPSLAQLKALATFLWNANPTDVDWWKKLVANPLDLILGLSIVPVQVPAGSALDYSPFTKFSLYLPFIGTRTISCDDIMGRTVHVKYNVDLLSGGCTAMVKITGGPDDNQLDAILYQYSGACAISIPLTGETFTNMITSTIQLAASIGATVATGGAASGVTAASAANSLMSMKPIIERAGGVSGAAGQLGIMQPYLIAEVPRQSVPVDCNKFTGYPSNMKATIGDLTGYTEVEIVYLQGIEATQAELDELESVLKGGFII